MGPHDDPAGGGQRLTPARVALLYAAFAALWIVSSGALLTLTVADPVMQGRIELGKGLLFVIVTSGLLYLVLKQWRDPLPAPDASPLSKPSHGLRWQVLAFVALAAVVPLAGFVVVRVQGPQIERDAYSNLESITELKVAQIESWLFERRNDGLVIMASRDLTRQVIAVQQPGGEALRGQLSERLVDAVDALQYEQALLVDPQGKPLVEIGNFGDLPPQTAGLLQQARESLQIGQSDVFPGEDGQLNLDLVVPLFLVVPDGRQTAGALILRIKPQRLLFASIQHWPTASPSGETMLLRRDGDAVQYINKLRHRPGAGMSLRLSLAQSDVPGVVAVKAGRPGRVQGNDYRGIPVLAAYRPVSGTDWMVVTKLDRDEVFAPLQSLAFWVSLIAFLSISSVAAVMLVLWRWRVRALSLEMRAQSDRLLRRFYDLPFIGISISSPTTKRWIKFNDRLCEILGYSKEEMERISWVDMTHPDDVAANLAEVDRVMRGESEGYTLDKRFIRKDGQTVFVTLDVKCLRDADGNVEYLFSTTQDITERKLADAKIRRLTRIYAALSECNQAIVRCTSEDELFPQVCRFAVQYGGMVLAWIGRLDEASGRVVPVASYGEGADFLQGLEVPSRLEESPLAAGVTASSIRELRPFWIQDYLDDVRTAPWHELATAAGWRGAAAFPLTRNGAVFGALTLYAAETDAFDDEIRNLLSEMALDISFALTLFARESERQRMEQSLRESESRFRDLYEKAPLPYQSLDVEGNILEVNEAWLNLLGRERDEVIGRFIGDFMADVSIGTLEREFPQFQQRGVVNGPHFEFLHRDGSKRLLMVNGQIARDKDGSFQRTHCILTDLTERQKTEEQLRLSAKVFEQSAEGVIITDPDLNILMVNRAFSSITGYSAEEAIGRNPRMLASGHHDAHFYRDLWDEVRSTGHWHGEMWNRRKDGDIYPELVSISQVLDADGKVTHFVGIFSDISEHKETQAHIQRLAHYDSLTGLPNRSLLADRVGQALARVDRNSEPLALVFLDLDRFKNVNDSLGHRVGDELLVQVAERLKTTLRDEDTVSRLGGDEFILVLPGATADGAAHVAEKVLQALSQPYRIEQHELTITPSLGIAMYPADGDSYESLSMCADAAMYRAKQAGRHTFRFFTREMQERSDRTLQLENALRRVLELKQLHLHYQPQLSLEENRVVGVEALLRWSHPELGEVSPADFIPVAEDSGLILPIGEWVLREAARQLKAWFDAGLTPLVMAVNLSAVQFRQANLPELVTRILDECGLPPHCLELELTEGVALDNPLASIAIMDDLYARGVRMSIDDFGTGYSSLNYLKRFKVSKLKIDQSFVRDIGRDPEGEAIVAAIIGLSRSLGLRTIAEGVETTEQLAFLTRRRCDEIQGYLLGRPMPAAEFETFVRGYRPASSKPG
jgi:diguanylate cyclase (GGDEF)-like protein/PAS domain S-box-containing protein